MLNHHRKPHRPGAHFALFAPVICIGALISFPAKSQEAADQRPLALGMRVRIVAPGILQRRLAGEISAMDGETITVEAADSRTPVTIPRNEIERVDLREGLRSRWENSGMGAATGAAAAALACVADNTHSSTGYVRISNTVAASVCGVFGAGIGALIGALIPPGEHWHRMATSRYRLSTMPRLDSQFGFRVMLGF